MTIAVGLYCSDGVVVGTDSSATSICGQLRTTEQPVRKLTAIDESVLLAGTGEIGLGQRFCQIVTDYRVQKKGFGSGRRAIDVAKELCAIAIADFNSTRASPGAYGALLAFSIGNTHHLCEFQVTNFQPELKTPDSLWYVAIGSGQPIVDPFLGLLRQAFWPNSPPTVALGVFCVTWALRHAVELNPGGINAPLQVGVLGRHSQGLRARILDDNELAEHEENVNGVVRYLSKYPETMRNQVSEKMPEP